MTRVNPSLRMGDIDLGFNFRAHHPRPFESLWSAAHKFLYLNAASNHSFLRHFGRKRAGISDLRFSGPIDIRKFSRAIRARPEWEAEATVDRWSTIFKPNLCSAPFLRFCPVCIEQGFHSSAFQLLDWRTCPAHDDFLRDSCPKCGATMPLKFPRMGMGSFACPACGYLLWLDIGADDWANDFESRETALRFYEAVLERHQGHSVRPFASGPRSAPVWVRKPEDFTPETDLTTIFAERIFAKPDVGYTRLWRNWGAEFETKRLKVRLPDSAYLALPIDDRGVRARIYAIYRLIERRLFRGFPYRQRHRDFGRVLTTIGFQRLPALNLRPEFLGYLVWRAYWEDRYSTLYSKRRFGEKFWGSFSQRRIERSVFWRFLQHTRLLRPLDHFTSADEWAQLHFFSIVARATYLRAIEFVKTTPNLPNVIRRGHPGRLVQVTPPLTLLVKRPREKLAFDLRIYA